MNPWIMLKKFRNKYVYLLYSPLNKILFSFNSVRYGEGLRVRGMIHIFKHYENGVIEIGKHVSINSAGWANPIGFGNKTSFQVFRNGKIEIGDYCGLSNAAISSGCHVRIGKHVMIGSGVKIYDTDFHPVIYEQRIIPGNPEKNISMKPVYIEDGAFIGAGSLILKGVRIGKHSVIGAGSVVTKSVPENEIWAGNPARFVKKIDVASCGSSAE